MKEQEESFEGEEYDLFLTVVMASWVYTFIKTQHIVYFKMQFLYVIYTSMKLVKHFFLKIFIYLFFG